MMTWIWICSWHKSSINPLLNDKILDLSKLKALAESRQLKHNSKLDFFFFFLKGRKLCRKGENAGYQYFLLFLQCFQKPFIEVRIVRERVKQVILLKWNPLQEGVFEGILKFDLWSLTLTLDFYEWIFEIAHLLMMEDNACQIILKSSHKCMSYTLYRLNLHQF